jgi:hypothetical protein
MAAEGECGRKRLDQRVDDGMSHMPVGLQVHLFGLGRCMEDQDARAFQTIQEIEGELSLPGWILQDKGRLTRAT